MRNQRDNVGTTPKFTVTNFAAAASLDCNGEAGATGVADTLATLIRTLTEKGIIDSDIS